jgi:hypothetical protein
MLDGQLPLLPVIGLSGTALVDPRDLPISEQLVADLLALSERYYDEDDEIPLEARARELVPRLREELSGVYDVCFRPLG